MKRKVYWDLLAAHADAMNNSQDVDSFDSEAWLQRYDSPVAPVSSLLPLLQIAQAIKRVLVPVRPALPFKVELQRQLAQTPPELTRERPRRRLVWALIGSVLSIAGLALLVLRHFKPEQNQSQPVTTAV